MSLNPYAAPAAADPGGVPDGPRSHGWYAKDGRLWVEAVATLPMIDPYSGESPERMRMNLVVVRYRPPWLWILPLGLAIAGAWAGAPSDRIGNSIAGCLIGLALRMLVGMVFPRARAQVFFSLPTHRWRRQLGAATTLLFLLNLLVGPAIEIARMNGMQFVGWVVPFLGWAWLSLLAYMFLIQRRMTCRRMRDGLFEIRRVHPRILEALAPESIRSQM
ncbi:hypothetical protein [Luteolibacter sp. LG18]|uniref:hypothetical protein n=1 Tax=Luteolibacter sp. LG18 TaxID=2819286 RepID=UPI002B305DFC|nr:hypothetical protein llg_14010 [Luteolibacter sp. LG18]